MPIGLEPLPERPRFRLRLHVDPYRDPWAIGVYVYGRGTGGTILRAKAPLVIEEVQEDNCVTPTEPIMRLDRSHNEDALQCLMDDLWALGIRPKDVGTAGHLAATQQHLADMRALVAHASGAKLP